MADRTEQFDALLNNRADQYNSEIQNNIPSLTAEIGSRSFPVPTELGELGDVNLTNPQNNQTLKYNSSTQKWENGNDIRASWGNITGTIDDQTDLKNKFDASLQMLSDTVGWTGKQLIPFPYRENSLTRDGVTFTVNSDGSVTLQTGSGGATSNTAFQMLYNSTILNDKAVYCQLSKSKTEFVAETDVEIQYSVRNSDASQKSSTRGTSFNIALADSPHSTSGEMLRVNLWVKSGKVITTPITVYPLVCLLSVTDTSYEPYHEDVDTAKANNSALAPVIDQDTAPYAIPQGKNFMHYGDFCTAKTAIANGATLTENSNYTVGDVADCLSAVSSVLIIASNSDISKLKQGINAVKLNSGMVVGTLITTPITLDNNYRGMLLRDGNNIMGFITDYISSNIYEISSTKVTEIEVARVLYPIS